MMLLLSVILKMLVNLVTMASWVLTQMKFCCPPVIPPKSQVPNEAAGQNPMHAVVTSLSAAYSYFHAQAFINRVQIARLAAFFIVEPKEFPITSSS